MNRPLYQTAVAPTYRRRAFVQIYIMNKDVTDQMDPHLISVQVLLRRMGVSTASIELDDRDASLPIPPDRASVKILMGWAGDGPTLPLNEHVKRIYDVEISDTTQVLNDKIDSLPYQASGMNMVFMGFITSVESGFARSGGGRRLWVECKATLDKSDGKTPSMTTLGEGQPDSGASQTVTIADFLAKVGKQHGFNVVANGVDNITRDFWAQDGESFLSMGQRLALEHGLNFEVWGSTAYLTTPDILPNGIATSTVEATWGTNLISWRIKPYAGRAQWKDTTQKFFDIWNGLWKSVTSNIPGSAPFTNIDATMGLPNAAPNAQAGQQTNQGINEESTTKRGTGWVIINGEPTAAPRGTVIISGARPGVDGSYRIDEAEHNYTRGGGYTTRCQLNKPNLDADDFKSSISELGNAEIERQLQEHPFFMWQNGMPDPVVPPELVPPAPPISH